jgi:hypothetical protein
MKTEKDILPILIVEDNENQLSVVFPTVLWSNPNDVTVLDLVSGHGSGTKEWYQTTKKPKVDERYTDLLNRVKSLYDDVELKVVSRWLEKYDVERYEEYRAKKYTNNSI